VAVRYQRPMDGTFCLGEVRRVSWRLGRDGMATSVLVIGVLVLAFLLGMAFYTSSSAEAHAEHRRLLGEQTALLTENMVTEAYYGLFTRMNSPNESRRFEPDVYARVRSLKDGGSFSCTFSPLLAWRTATLHGFQLKPVQVRFEQEITSSEVRSVSYKYQRTAASPPPLPAGVRRRSCYTRGAWVPEIKWIRVGRGKLHLTASAQITGSETNPVIRTRETVYPYRIIEVSQKPNVKWIDMIPIQDYQIVDRGGGK
jgi:hypothetical protein